MGKASKLKKLRKHAGFHHTNPEATTTIVTNKAKVIAQVSQNEDGTINITDKIVEPEQVKTTGNKKIYKALKIALTKGLITVNNKKEKYGK